MVMMIAAMATWHVNLDSQTKGMSDISLANVEALATHEYLYCPNGFYVLCLMNQGTCCCIVNGEVIDNGVFLGYNCE